MSISQCLVLTCIVRIYVRMFFRWVVPTPRVDVRTGLEVSVPAAHAFWDMLRHNSTLWELDLSSGGLTDEHMRPLPGILRGHSGLYDLYLLGNRISGSMLSCIGSMLSQHRTLKVVNLAFNRNEDGNDTAFGFAESLQAGCRLCDLDLGSEWLSVLCCSFPSGLLLVGQSGLLPTDNVGTAQLCLHGVFSFESENKIGETGAVALANAVLHNHRLLELGLEGPRLSCFDH